MNNSTAVFLINDKVRAIYAGYEPEKKGSDKALFKTFDPTIKVDDLIVVPTGTRYGMTVCKVLEVDVEFDIDTPVEVKWVVEKVNLPAHEKVLAEENEAIQIIRSAEKRKKRDELRKAIFADQAEALGALPIAHTGQPHKLEAQ